LQIIAPKKVDLSKLAEKRIKKPKIIGIKN
jgi:hypothetical protein